MIAISFTLLLATQPGLAPPGPLVTTASAEKAVEAEVRENILNQQLGPATVADTALPEVFLLRATDRVIRKSYQDQRSVVLSAHGESAASALEEPAQADDIPVNAERNPLSGTRSAAYLYGGLGLALIGVSALLLWLAKSRGGAN